MYQNQGPTNILWCVVRTRIRALRTFWGVLYVPESGPHEHFVVCCTYQSPHVRESTKVLDSGSHPLDSGSQHLDSGFQPFGFRIPTFWIPDSIPKWWIPDSKPLWIPDSSVWIPDSKSKNLLDSGFSYTGRYQNQSPTNIQGIWEQNSCCRMLAGFVPDASTGSKP